MYDCCACNTSCFREERAYENGCRRGISHILFPSQVLYKNNNKFKMCHSNCFHALDTNNEIFKDVTGIKRIDFELPWYDLKTFLVELNNYINLIRCDIVDEQELKNYFIWKKEQLKCYTCKRPINYDEPIICGISNNECVCVHSSEFVWSTEFSLNEECITQKFIDSTNGFICEKTNYTTTKEHLKELILSQEQKTKDNLKLYQQYFFCHECNKRFIRDKKILVVSYPTHEELYHKTCIKNNEEMIIVNDCTKIEEKMFRGDFYESQHQLIEGIITFIYKPCEYNIYLLKHQYKCVYCNDAWYENDTAIILFTTWDTYDVCHKNCMKKMVGMQNKYCGVNDTYLGMPKFPLSKEDKEVFHNALLELSVICASCNKRIDKIRKINVCYLENGRYELIHRTCKLKPITYIGLSKGCYMSDIKQWKDLTPKEQGTNKGNLTYRRKHTV